MLILIICFSSLLYLLCSIKRTILIVEDNSELRENTAELLQLGGYNVITAPDGRKGLEQILKFKPDLVLCDILKPRTGGIDLLKKKMKNSEISKIPVIFLSAGSAPPSPDQMEKPDAYLSKPFTYEQLINIVKNYLSVN